LPDFLQTRKNGGILRKNAVLFELWAGSNQLWPKRVGMSAIPCGVWVSGLSQSGLKRPAPEVNLPKSYNTRNNGVYSTSRVRMGALTPWLRLYPNRRFDKQRQNPFVCFFWKKERCYGI